jgi:hypothetical protein
VARPQTAAERQNVSAGESPRGVEWLCVGECLRFSLRHYRYFLIFLVLYWRSVWHWRRTRAARYGFCFLQLYDDIMDGDRVTAAAPDDIAAQTIAEWESGQFRGDTSLSRLGAALKDALQSLQLRPEDDPRHDVMMLLKAMHRDAQRVATRATLTHAELKAHLHTTFHHSINLLLISSQMQARAKSVSDLVAALGWCSVERDLEEDLRKGLINVPTEVMNRVTTTGGNLAEHHPEIRSWRKAEKLAVLNRLQNSALTLQALATYDPHAARLLKLFHRSIERHAKEERIGFFRRGFGQRVVTEI